jgi:hypothetical protein
MIGVGADVGTRDRLIHLLVGRIGHTARGPKADGVAARQGCSAADLALRRLLAAGGSPPDDAIGVVGTRIEPEALIRALEETSGCDPGGGPGGVAVPFGPGLSPPG